MSQPSMQSSICWVGSFPGTQKAQRESRPRVSFPYWASVPILALHVPCSSATLFLWIGLRAPSPTTSTPTTLWSFTAEWTEVFFPPFGQGHISIILNDHHPPFSKLAPEDQTRSGKHLGKPGSFQSTMPLSHTASSPRTSTPHPHSAMLPL